MVPRIAMMKALCGHQPKAARAENGSNSTHQESPDALWLVVGRSHDLSIYRQILVPHR
jgi:hypothetical protein